jgi:DNA-binding CsgD family transcriptional regulator/Flp pilus assembly protein TadD
VGVAPQLVAGPLLEREDELAEIDRRLGAARDGSGSLALLEGPGGIGKTRLLAEARRAAAAAGLTVLNARGSELEREFPYGVVRQLLEPVFAAGDAPERRDLLAGAAALAAPLFAVDEPDARVGTEALSAERPGAVLHGLYWLCTNLAQQEPVLVAVDDAHWADRASLGFLAYLAGRLEQLPIALVVAARPAEAEYERDLLVGLALGPTAVFIRPRPLSPRATRALIVAGLGGEPEQRFVDACHAASGGSPFLLRELIRELAANAVPPTAAESERIATLAPPTLARAVVVRLRRLAAGALELARAVSVLGADAELRRAGRLAELDDPGPVADLLADAGILEPARPLVFAHPIVRSAVYRDMPTAERARLHAAAARMLVAEGTPADRVGSHLLATEPAGEQAVVETLRAAARSALHSGAADSAVAYLRRALAEPPAQQARAGLLLELGFAESHAHEPAAADHLRQAVELAPGSPELLAGTLALGRTLMNSGRTRDALETFRQTAERVGREDEHAQLMLQGALLGAAQIDRGGAALVAELATRLQARVEDRADAPASVFGPLAAAACLAGEPAEQVAELAERALRGNERVLPEAIDRPPGFYAATHALAAAERFERARRLYALTLADARRLGSALHFVLASAFRAALEYRAGRVADAEADARQALGADPAQAPPAWAALAAATLAFTLCERGELAEADAELERHWPGHEHAGMLTHADVLWARGRLRLSQARPANAVEDLLAAGQVLDQLLAPNPAYARWRSDAALAVAALDQQHEARRLCAEELRLARAFGAPGTLGATLRAAGLVEGGKQGLELLHEAVSTLSRSQATLEYARALTDLGAALRRAGQRSESREPLRQALDLAHRCGATALAERARTELTASGARPRRIMLTGIEALTPSERRVAEMAAGGMTNREIAQTLFVTLRTVEIHLTHTYQKLEINSREQLPNALEP